MLSPPPFVVRGLDVAETYELRRRVLRNNDPGAQVHIREDDRADAMHIGAVTEQGEILATASFYGIPCRQEPAAAEAVQLRMMAVDGRFQNTGVGGAVLQAAVKALRSKKVPLLWANARDVALGFYREQGFEVVGEGFVEPTTGIAHHVVLKRLD